MPITEAKTLLQFLLDLLRDPDTKAAFAADPHGALASAGLDGLCFDDVKDALPLVLDHAPPHVAAKYDDDVRAATASSAAVVSDHHAPPGHHMIPAPIAPDHHGGTEIDKIVAQLNYVSNTYSFDSHDTTLVTALDQHIIANGDVTTSLDVHPQIASGDGAVAVGGDLAAPVATGAGAIAGDGNLVNGAGNAAFGDGDVSTVGGSIGADDGSAVSLTGDAAGDQANSSAASFGAGDSTAGSGEAAVAPTHDESDNSTTTATSASADNSIHDSGNTDSHDTTAGTLGEATGGEAAPLFAADGGSDTGAAADAVAVHDTDTHHEVAVG